MSGRWVGPSGLSSEADAYEFLEQLCWGEAGPESCPHCGSDRGAWFLKPKDPDGRKSKGGSSARSQRRVWKCRETACRRQFSVLTGTVMHGTKMPVQCWIEVIDALCSEERGLSARDISERWGVAEKSALLMLTRIQHAFARPEVAGANLGSNAPLWVPLQAQPVAQPSVAEPSVAQPSAGAASLERSRLQAEERAAEVKADVARALAEALGDTAALATAEPKDEVVVDVTKDQDRETPVGSESASLGPSWADEGQSQHTTSANQLGLFESQSNA